MLMTCNTNKPAMMMVIIIICLSLLLFIYHMSTKNEEVEQVTLVSDQSELSVFNVELNMAKVFETLRNQRALIEELACASKGIGARGGFCLSTSSVDVGGNSMWDHKLALNLESLFENKTVGDFGAGLGWYGRFWLRKTTPMFTYGNDVEISTFLNQPWVRDIRDKPQRILSWEGFDGAGNVELVTNRLVRFLDLTEEHDLPQKYDWVISLEVGEHIPPAFENVFVENLVRHACQGVVISWAVEGQGGHYHVNNHNNTYVIDVFKKYGFNHQEYWERRLRSEIYHSYFVNTLMVFDRVPPLIHKKCIYHNK